MTTVNLSLSAVRNLKPSTVNGIQVDGFVGGRPVTIRRNQHGGVVPAIGSTFKSTYGTAEVVGYVEGALKARIIDFDEDYGFETLDTENPDILTAQECVESLSRCANSAIQSLVSDIHRIYSTESGNLPKARQEYVDSIEWFASNEYRCNLTDAYELLTEGTEILCDFVHSYLLEKETPRQRRQRLAIEREQAVALANKLLGDSDDAVIPEDVQAEMEECFGEF